MKVYSYALTDWQRRRLNDSCIREKSDIIKLLMHAIKHMLNESALPLEEHGGLSLVVSKMSRLFIFNEHQHFSIWFPFGVQNTSEGMMFTSKEIGIVDQKVTSDVLSVISDYEESGFSNHRLLDALIDQSALRPSFLSFYFGLLQSEDGYIRYDHDPVNEDGRFHPLHHLDLFYSSGNTFKFGLYTEMRKQNFIGLLDVLAECCYVENKSTPEIV